MPEPVFMKCGMYIMAPESISTAYFINPSPQSGCLSFIIIAREELGKNVTAAMNTYATIEESLNASFSMWSVSYQRKGGDCYPCGGLRLIS
jgi:hypothetical protein